LFNETKSIMGISFLGWPEPSSFGFQVGVCNMLRGLFPKHLEPLV